MLKLVKSTDPVLREKTKPFNFDGSEGDLKRIVPQMIKVMKANNGIGLAAPQVGLSLRIFIMEIDEEGYICINPVIIGTDTDSVTIEEGCLSFPGIRLGVSRFKSVIVEYQNPMGETISEEFNGTTARCFQHELDHLDGITFDQKVTKLVLNMAKRRLKKAQKKEKSDG